ncbi:MAG: transcriptional regulator [Myxococcota bacterium]
MTKSKREQYIIKTECFELWRERISSGGDRVAALPERVEIARRPLDLLSYLSANRDRVVGRDELMAEVWGGVAVSPGAIDTTVYELRRAVGDLGRRKSERWVETVRGRGFRLGEEARVRVEGHPQGSGEHDGLALIGRGRLVKGDASAGESAMWIIEEVEWADPARLRELARAASRECLESVLILPQKPRPRQGLLVA